MNKRDKLTGVLIGLARATFGNEDIITPDTYPTIIKGLTAGEEEIDRMVETVQREKYRIVPDCAVCTVKCGRNEDFDMAQLESEPPAEKKAKLTLLETAVKLAHCVSDGNDSRANSFFTKALMMTGTAELPAEFILPAIEEGQRLLEKYK